MPDSIIAPYGSWDSPLTAELVAAGSISLGDIAVDAKTIYWTESRPAEGGRLTIMCRTPDDAVEELLPAPFNARTRVHEYGGGALWVNDGTVYFVNYSDQRVYRFHPGEEPQPLTPEGSQMRYADGIVDRQRQRIICVREDHSGSAEAVNTIVSLALDGRDGPGQILAGGHDFYASPTLSPDGSQLAWLAWNHPNMPWDGTELWVGTLDAQGDVIHQALIAGGERESVFQPAYSPAGELHFVSDRSGWWNLYRYAGGHAVPVHEREAEFGVPQWVFGMATYGFDGQGRIVTVYFEHGQWQLALLDPDSAELTPMRLPYTDLDGVRAGDDFVVLRAGSATEPTALLRVSLRTQQIETLREVGKVTVSSSFFSVPEPVDFPTRDGQTAHAYFYPPQNPGYRAPDNELPPLLVSSHGGPTSSARTMRQLSIHFWTSRGIAVLDVNYRGSTGYGREYRDQLKGNWGLIDVTDCIDGARHLVQKGRVDGERVAIHGGSAGGYTTLCALTVHDFFRAGASYFGVSDLAALARDTHKFESRYLEALIGPENLEERYYERSPIHFAAQLSCPVIFLQGLDDPIVPPNQAELMVNVLREKGLPVAYLEFEGESHGFRRAESQRRALESELYFYGRIFGFTPAGDVQPVPIDNL